MTKEDIQNRIEQVAYDGATDGYNQAVIERESEKLAIELVKLFAIPDVRQRIVDYTNWLSEQNLMICEGVDGYTFRSSMIGGKKYSAEELYEKYVSEYVA